MSVGCPAPGFVPWLQWYSVACKNRESGTIFFCGHLSLTIAARSCSFFLVDTTDLVFSLMQISLQNFPEHQGMILLLISTLNDKHISVACVCHPLRRLSHVCVTLVIVRAWECAESSRASVTATKNVSTMVIAAVTTETSVESQR